MKTSIGKVTYNFTIFGTKPGFLYGPCYANTFLYCHEQAGLNNCTSNYKTILYRRYMDGTFLLFSDPSHINRFLSWLN